MELCSPPAIYLGPNYGGGNEDNGDLPQKVQCMHSVPQALQQATTDPRLCWRLLDIHGQVWVSLLWCHCSFLLGPGANKVLFVPSKSISQACVSSGSCMVGLMATSSKRAHAILKSAVPRALPLGQSTADPYLHRRCSKHSSVSVSVGFLCPGVHKVCLSPLSVSGGSGI